MHGGIAATDADLEMVAPVMLTAATAIHVHGNLATAEFEAGNLHAVAGIDGGAMRCDGAV